jgi:hypothetical protein
MLPLALALGGAAIGAKQAQDQRADSRRQADMNALMASGQTAYSGLTGAGPGKIEASSMGPSVMGGALSGGVAGYSQGQAIGQAQSQQGLQNAYAELLKKQAAQGSIGSPVPMAGNPYSQSGMV